MRRETKCTIGTCWLAIWFGLTTSALSQERTVYYTGFESEQGYDMEITLIGQDEWHGAGKEGIIPTGGNGLIRDYIENLGQQGYIGYWPPEEATEPFTSLWRPVKGIGPEETRITVTMLMMIVDSTNDQRDDFRWTLYNNNVRRLMTLDFDNETRNINYALDDDILLPTGYRFKHETLYELKFVLDFAANTWTASIGDEGQGIVLFIKAKKLTTTGLSLIFGDLGPSWVYRNPETPGDNYMVFDEYRITAEIRDEIPKASPTLEWAGSLINGRAKLLLGGKATMNYIVEASDDLKNWTSIETTKLEDTWKEVLIDTRGHTQRFYRARAVD
ncbi:MAG: hypothetical protein VX392_05400 [Verrucomicrobiota bacterium]|nr:hypothetical protein [Verrucomicrobiota bacterium]